MLRRAIIRLGLAAAVAPGLTAATPKWRTLFDGKSLDGWDRRGSVNWGFEGGAVVADKGSGFLVSKETFGDVAIRAEVWVSPDANSGIFIRCTNPFQVGTQTAYEVNLYDARPDPTYGTGAIVGVAKVSPMPVAGGRWNVMDITARGDRFDVSLNGVRTVENAHDGRFSHGRIALQYGAGVVKFRRVQVRAL